MEGCGFQLQLCSTFLPNATILNMPNSILSSTFSGQNVRVISVTLGGKFLGKYNEISQCHSCRILDNFALILQALPSALAIIHGQFVINCVYVAGLCETNPLWSSVTSVQCSNKWERNVKDKMREKREGHYTIIPQHKQIWTQRKGYRMQEREEEETEIDR